MASLFVGGGAEPRGGRTRTRATLARGRGHTEAEAGSSPDLKRSKVADTVAAATVAEPTSTVTLFRDLAAGWIKKEEDWYGKPNAEYKPIDNRGKQRVDRDHLAKAQEEYKKRFVFCTEEEDAESPQYSGSPYLLVATNVQSTWQAPALSQARFMLVPMQEGGNSALFITFMPGSVHGRADFAFAQEIAAYMSQNHLLRVVSTVQSGGGSYQPDIRLFPTLPDPNPPAGTTDVDPDNNNRAQSRVVIEIEFGNRNADALREVGHTVLSNEYGSLFVGIKIWKRTQAGTFGAAIVVWEKNRATGAVNVREAIDFGTKILASATKNAWNKPANNPGMPITMLPPVPVQFWRRPLPLPAQPLPPGGQPPPPAPAGWSLDLPRDSLLYRMPANNPVAQYLTAPALHIPDLSIDLKVYQGILHDILD